MVVMDRQSGPGKSQVGAARHIRVRQGQRVLPTSLKTTSMDDLRRVLRVWADLGLSVVFGALLGLAVALIFCVALWLFWIAT